MFRHSSKESSREDDDEENDSPPPLTMSADDDKVYKEEVYEQEYGNKSLFDYLCCCFRKNQTALVVPKEILENPYDEDADNDVNEPHITVFSKGKEDEAFSYNRIAKLAKNDIIQCEGGAYQARYTETFVKKVNFQGFVIFEKINQHRLLSQKNKGYKLHISLDDTQQDGNLENGWKIIREALMKNEIAFSKVIRDEERENLRNSSQKGKEITIYIFKEKREPEDWKKFIKYVTKKLKKAGIKPGPLALGDDLPIQGSNYFSYRNDGPASTDPFKGMVIENETKGTPISQPNRPGEKN